MTTFKWKRKAGDNVCHERVKAFSSNTKEENNDHHFSIEDVGLLDPAKRPKIIALEDRIAKKNRLKDEGVLLASSKRYWEALKKWDEACQLCSTDEKLYEMRAQALLELQEVFPAIQVAERAIQLNPRWWVAYQTLGRAQLGAGEVHMAIKSFSKACHLNPSEIELWREDLEWACSLRKKSGEIAKNDASETLKEKTLHIYEMNEAQDCCHANEAIRESLTKSTKPLSIVSETIDATQKPAVTIGIEPVPMTST